MQIDIATRQAYEAHQSVFTVKNMPKNWQEARAYRNYLLGKQEYSKN